MSLAPGLLRLISESSTFAAFLDSAAAQVCQLHGADACDLMLLQGDQHLVLSASTSAPEMVGRVKVGLHIGIVGRVMQSGVSLPVPVRADLPEHAITLPDYDERIYEAAHFSPILTQKGPIGVAVLRKRDAWSLNSQRVAELDRSVTELALGIEAYQNLATRSSQVNQLGAMREVTDTIAQSPYLEEILQLLVSLTAQQFNYLVCSVRLLDETNSELVLRATQATMPEYKRKRSIKVGESIAGRAVVLMKPIIVTDVQSEADYIGHDLAERQGLHSMACIPMTVHNKAIGVLTVYTDSIRSFTDAEILALETIAKQAAFSIERAKLQVRHTLMQEMHHRVKNNLQQVVSLLRLQLRHRHYPTIDDAINDSIGRILAIAAVHDLLSREDLDRVALKTIAESLVGHLQQGMISPGKRIAFDVRGQDIVLGMTQATQIALILNELILNAVQHAFVDRDLGEVHITFETQDDRVMLWVANNGTPLPDSFNLGSHSHLGLQIVSNLARSLGGSLILEDRLGWTVAEINFERGAGD